MTSHSPRGKECKLHNSHMVFIIGDIRIFFCGERGIFNFPGKKFSVKSKVSGEIFNGKF